MLVASWAMPVLFTSGELRLEVAKQTHWGSLYCVRITKNSNISG